MLKEYLARLEKDFFAQRHVAQRFLFNEAFAMTPPTSSTASFKQRLAVIGDPIAHSLSPALQNFLIAHFNLPFVYEAVHVAAADLPRFVARLRNGEFAGVNVTLPHKQSLIPFLDELLAPADRIAAVNTVCVANGKLLGHNTDAVGFQRSLDRAQINVREERVLLLGAGGAAKAVVFALLAAGARVIHLCNRHAERAEQLRAGLLPEERARVQLAAWEERERVLAAEAVALVINATSVGMAAGSSLSPLPARAWRNASAAVDLIYNPAETLFLRQARAAGATVLNGLPMLIYQGAAALELWSGRKLEIDGIYGRLEERLMSRV
jgi:shikimate dehydrogenase